MEFKIQITVIPSNPEYIEDIQSELDELKSRLEYQFEEVTGYKIDTIEVETN